MKKALMVVSLAGLALTILPAVLVFLGRISWKTHAGLMALGMVLWFVTAPFWLGAGKKEA